MRFITPVILLLLSTTCMSQSLTGIWRGYFIQNDFDMLRGQKIEDKYKYELQLNNLHNNGIEGVTYSYKNTVFYGKASLQGLFTKATKNLIVRELKMLELKISDNSSPCLMTCYLDYSKEGKKEILQGTYTSVNEKKADCGNGIVYLERVITTDFEKEPFLLKKKKEALPEKPAPLAKAPENKVNKEGNATSTLKKPTTKLPSTPSVKQPAFKPGAEGFMVTKEKPKQNAGQPQLKKDTIPSLTEIPKKITEPTLPVPQVLIDRKNDLQNTLVVESKDIQIDFFDNGQIDNDTITVYHNNQILINKGRLDSKPISINVHLDEANPFYELITVAENLGDVAPNTALMVVKAGKKRYEVTITSDDKKNAKVILEYKSPSAQQK